MRPKKIEASVDLLKSEYAVFDRPVHDTELDANLVGHEITRPDYSLTRKTFQYFGLELITKGKGKLHLRGIEHPLHRGVVFTYGPDINHRIDSDHDEPLEKYFIDLTLVATRYDSPIHQPGLVFETTRTDRLVSLFKGMLDDVLNGVDDGRIRRTTVRLILDLASLDIDRENPVNSPAYLTFQAAKSHIEEHLHTINSLIDLAKAMKTDTSYLSRLFKRYANESPYQYIMRQRLSRACYLLKRHDMQIQEIAEVLGFSDPFHFSTVFKRHIGVSPRIYRTHGGPEEESSPPNF